MADLNPYEPPQSEQPLKPRQIAKRGIGLTTILWLTPVALGIAMAGSCKATDAVVNSLYWRRENLALMFLVGWSVALIPPVITFAGMIWWARRAYLRDAVRPKTNPGDDRG